MPATSGGIRLGAGQKLCRLGQALSLYRFFRLVKFENEAGKRRNFKVGCVAFHGGIKQA